MSLSKKNRCNKKNYIIPIIFYKCFFLYTILTFFSNCNTETQDTNTEDNNFNLLENNISGQTQLKKPLVNNTNKINEHTTPKNKIGKLPEIDDILNVEEEKQKLVLKYILSNKGQELKSLLKNNSEIDLSNPIYIIEAASEGKYEILKILIENGAFFEKDLCYEETALDHSPKNSKSYNLLVKAGAKHSIPIPNSNTQNRNGDSIIREAQYTGNSKLLVALIKKNKLTQNEENDLFFSAASDINHDFRDVISALLDKDLDIDTARNEHWDGNQITPLMKAASSQKEIIEFLLSKGADITKVDSKGNSVLHHAFNCGNVSLENIKCLVENNADINAVNKKGKSVLDRVSLDHDSAYNYLVSLGANHSSPITPERAVYLGKTEKLKEILDNKTYWNNYYKNRDDPMSSLLPLATKKGNLEIIKILISKGATISTSTTIAGLPSCIYELTKKNDDNSVSVIEYFIDNKIDIGVSNLDNVPKGKVYNFLKRKGFTYKNKLFSSVKKENIEDVKNCVGDFSDEEKAKAISIAVSHFAGNSEEIVKVIIGNGLKIDQDYIKYLIVWRTIASGKAEALKLLFENNLVDKNTLDSITNFNTDNLRIEGMNVDDDEDDDFDDMFSRDTKSYFKKGFPAIFGLLQFRCWGVGKKEFLQTMNILLKNGVRFNYINKEGRSLLHLAANVNVYSCGSFFTQYILSKKLIPVNIQINNPGDKYHGYTPLDFATPGTSNYDIIRKNGGKHYKDLSTSSNKN